MKKTLTSYILATLLLPIFVNATTYYVSVSGSDGNPGTAQISPWKTIQKVNSGSYKAGDQILFKRGDTWHEQLIVPSTGSSGNPIIFGAYGTGNRPIINGQKNDSAISVKGKSYITIEGLEVKETGGLYIISIKSSSYVTVKNSKVHNGDISTIYLRDSSYITIDSNELSDVNRPLLPSYASAVIKIAYSNNNIVRNNHISDSPYMLIHLYDADNNIIEKNIMSGPASTGIYMRPHADNNIFRYNYVTGVSDISVQIRTNENNNEIHHNIFYDVSGIQTDGDGSNPNDGMKIYNNTIYIKKSDKWGISIRNSNTNCLVKNNAVVTCGSSALKVQSNSKKGTTSDYNLFRGPGKYLIRWGDSTYYSMSQFSSYQRVSGQDLHSITCKPLFVNPDNGDFTPLPESPVCGAGEGGSDIGALACEEKKLKLAILGRKHI